MRLHRALLVGSVVALNALVLAGCGPSVEDQQATKLEAICTEANAVMSKVGIDQIAPSPTTDWNEIQSIYGGIASTLQNLSKEAASLDNSQLARDFSSVGKAASQVEAVASLVTTVGFNTVVADEWFSAVDEFTGNEALQAANDRTFIGCL